ncbi:hypothetical protein [Bradyrhizobium sp. SZCCHNRI1009]|uniref:hypothetical protein n=1 Tax=Bradyrhizobium sp. SZCCHNRI1009 TaxID=3057277 RepID=UPI0029170F76|nr:hypothetical protein [Bradyrhizobium sp. SZCCHNRI1009]
MSTPEKPKTDDIDRLFERAAAEAGAGTEGIVREFLAGFEKDYRAQILQRKREAATKDSQPR